MEEKYVLKDNNVYCCGYRLLLPEVVDKLNYMDYWINHLTEKNNKIRIFCVEDGSVDIDDIENNGLRDGKIVVYRQGSRPPYVLEIKGE